MPSIYSPDSWILYKIALTFHPLPISFLFSLHNLNIIDLWILPLALFALWYLPQPRQRKPLTLLSTKGKKRKFKSDSVSLFHSYFILLPLRLLYSHHLSFLLLFLLQTQLGNYSTCCIKNKKSCLNKLFFLYFIFFLEGPGGGPLQGAKGQTPDWQRQQFYRQSPAHGPWCIAFRTEHPHSQLSEIV